MTKYALNLKEFLTSVKNVTKSTASGTKKILLNKKVLSTLGARILFGVGAELVDSIIAILKEKYNIYKSKEYFDKMLKAHPQLKNYNKEEIAKYYASLNHFAPSVAKDPLAAGAYLTQSLKKLSSEELGGPPPDTFNTLVDIEKKFTDARSGRSRDKGNKYFQSFVNPIISDVAREM